MKLNNKELKNEKVWKDAGFDLPQFDRQAMIQATKENPEWIHFGGGNIFRAFPAAVLQDLLNRGIVNTGVIVAEGFDYEIIDKSFRDFDDLSVLVTLKADGTLDKTVIGSIAESLKVDTANEEDWTRLTEIFKNQGLKMVSFTITEKGYSLTSSNGEFYPDVTADFEKKPELANSYIGKLVALLYVRFKDSATPVTLVSMDNVSHNGDKLLTAVTTFADKWAENNIVEAEFKDYVREKISYPWSMIDKITPRPADSVIKMLEDVGFEDTNTVVTSRNTYVAPFVNAEESQYLVIEDKFLNGKIPFDTGGVIYTDKETVDKVETMKVTTCLNPLHTALAVYGCLLGFEKISDEMADPDLLEFVKRIGYVEGLPVVVDPGILDPKEFLDECINVRFPNPFMPDTPQRIATDTSQKLAIRFGETIKSYVKAADKDVADLTFIPLVLAGWCRYLMAIDDEGNEFELSPDPLISTLTPIISKISLGQTDGIHEALKDILSNEKIFGINLYEVGLGEKVESLFAELNAGPGAIRGTLQKYLA